MLRLALASLAGAATVFIGVALLPDTELAMYGTGLTAMFVTAALAPHVFFRGEPVRKPPKRPHS